MEKLSTADIHLELESLGVPNLVYYYQSLPSTMDKAFSLAFESIDTAELILVVAGEQSAGRGRNGHSWESLPSGNLYLSVAFCLEKLPSQVGGFPLAFGYELLEVLRDAYKLEPEQLKLKWPNDIVTSEAKKTVGILIENKCLDKIVVNVGVGVNTDFAPLNTSASLADLGKLSIPYSELVARIAYAVYSSWHNFLKLGFASYREKWLKNSFFWGEVISTHTADGEVITGIMHGVDDNGALLLDCQGEIKKVYSGMISGCN